MPLSGVIGVVLIILIQLFLDFTLMILIDLIPFFLNFTLMVLIDLIHFFLDPFIRILYQFHLAFSCLVM